MPFVRDYASAYESTTTDAGITIPMCNQLTNDLLLVFAMADTGAGTWGCSGYTQLFARNATSSIVCYYKIATSAAEADVVVTNTVTETYNGCVIAIGDIDTAFPFGNPAAFTETTGTGTRVAMPTVTTQRDNSLVIYHAASIGNNAGIHFVEGQLHELLISDGAAEGQGVGWLLQKTAGVSPTVYGTSPVSTVTKAAICINPPSAGAAVIPPYCVSDASLYLDHNASATAFDGNTALAATADTNFGTSIASRTCNDATVALSADIGINSFHGMMGMTNATTANQMSGANVVLAAARYNIGTRNVLAHFRHTTPAHNQRLSNIGSGKGVWMGLRSGTTAAQNWKVWQVHGSDAIMTAGYLQPLIVNCANTDTIATNGTLSSSDVRYVGFWNGGLGTLTNQTCIGPMWALDTVVIAGGSSTLPISITETVDVAARAKERLSSIQQGAKQMLCLQKLQFGDGGTNPIYLNLDSTAIEFPSRKNADAKIVNYNGIDDSVGISYYPGASDTIIHKNSVISSGNKFSWGLHASANTGAAYDFSGTAVIGAGTISLARAITIDGLTINGYGTLDISGLTLINSAIKSPPSSSDSLTTSAATSVDYSNINVSTLTAGNRWCSVADPTIFSYCSFTGSASSGHAIRLTTPGNYSLVGNTFNSFGGDGTTSAAIFNDSTGAVTLNISGAGNTPTIRNGTNASTTVNNAVTIIITVKDESNAAIVGASVAIYKESDLTQLMNEVTIAGGVASEAFNYTTDTPIIIRIRKSTVGSTRYVPVNTTGTITATGFTLTVTLIQDIIAGLS